MRPSNPNDRPEQARDPLNRVTQHLDDDAPPDAIKADIGRTRQAMDRTLDEIADRMRPRRWVEEAIDAIVGSGQHAGSVREAGFRRAREWGRDGMRFARRHPVPTALLVCGVAALAAEKFGRPIGSRRSRSYSGYSPDVGSESLGGTTPMGAPRPRGSVTGRPVYGEPRSPAYRPDLPASADYPHEGSGMAHELKGRAHEWGEGVVRRAESFTRRLSSAAHHTADAARATTRGVRRAASSAAGRLSEAASHTSDIARTAGEGVRHAADRVSHLAEETAHCVSDGARIARERTHETVESHPLAVGAAMFGVGLLAGVAVPSSRREDRWFGEESDEVKHAARRLGQDVLHRGRDVAMATAATAKETAKEEAQRRGLTPEAIAHRVEEEVAGAASEMGRHNSGQKSE